MPFALAVAEPPTVGDIAPVVELPADVAVAPALAADAGARAADVEARAAAYVVFSPIPASRTPIAPLPVSPPPPSLFLVFPSLVVRAALACAWLVGTTPAGAVVAIVGLAVAHVAAEPAVGPAIVASTPSNAPAPSEQHRQP